MFSRFSICQARTDYTRRVYSRAAVFPIIVGLTMSVNSTKAALYQSSDWAVVGKVGGSVGYDSNLTASAGGPGDGFATFEPGVIVKRYDSDSKFEFSGGLVGTTFFDGRSPSQIDVDTSVDYAYPYNDEQLPRLTGYARFHRSTIADPTVGKRITSEVYTLTSGGRVYSSGKWGIDASLSYNRTQYAASIFNTSQDGELTLSLAFNPSPVTEYSINVVSGVGDTVPTIVGNDRVNNIEEEITFKAQTDLASKTTGSLFVGAEMARFRGDYRRTELIPVAGGEVIWNVTQRGYIKAAPSIGVDYTPDGEVRDITKLTLIYHQTIFGAWAWEVSSGPEWRSYHQDVHTRSDRDITIGSSIDYQPSDRFTVSFSYTGTFQGSSVDYANFNRHLTYFSTEYHF